MAISSAVDASAVARVVGIKTEYIDLRAGNIVFLPQRIAVVGQGNTAATYDTTKKQVTSATQVGNLYGYGSPLYLAVRELFPPTGGGVGTIPVTVYPLEDDGSGVASAGDITPTVSQTEAASYTVKVNNIESEPFVISVGDAVADVTAAITAAVNAVLEMPVIATDNSTDVGIEAKWAGESGNDLYIEIDGPTDAGTTFAFTQPTGGLVNPEISTAIDQVGDVWETLFINCMNPDDTTTLDDFEAFGEPRWGALTRKPCLVFRGATPATVSAAISVPDARKTDRVNVQIPSPGANDLPLVVASAAVAKIAPVANNNPPRDYGSRDLPSLTPGVDGDQWNFTQRDQAVKGGSSTIEVKNGVVNLSDTVTHYHPDGEPFPPYRYVVDIVKLMNVIFNLDLIFNTAEWDGAPLIPDGQPTVNPDARTPSSAKAAAAAMLDSLGDFAIISDPETAKANIQAGINSMNPKRLDLSVPVQLSGNANIISVDLDFGFFFGG